MNELLPRTYRANTRAEQKALPFGVGHPAKMSAQLARDLFLRYTLPGQTVLDPFGGRGTSLIGCLLGRNVILHELESPFVEYARANWKHLQAHTLPGLPLGEAIILQGDSRHLPLATASEDAVVSSPPYADTLNDLRNEEKKIAQLQARIESGQVPAGRAYGRGVGFSPKYSADPANIGNLPHNGDVAAVVSSPPYADVASRDRSEEPYSQARDPLLKAKYGTGDANRHIDGYGHSEGQIGALPHAAITSPPYTSVVNQSPRVQSMRKAVAEGRGGPSLRAYLAEIDSGSQSKAGFADGGYGTTKGQIGETEGETYAAACLAVYRECFRVVRSGGMLILVTGNYVRSGEIIDLAADTIALAQAAGWTPVERWRHEKSTVSFWRRLHRRQGRPVVTHEDVLVFCKGPRRAWDFAALPPTSAAPADLTTSDAAPPPSIVQPLPLEMSL